MVRGKAHVMACIRNNYSMLISGDRWRLEQEASGVRYSDRARQSSLAGAQQVDFDDMEFQVRMLRGRYDLDDRTFDHLQDAWAIEDATYMALRLRYRNELKRSARNRPARNAADKVQIPEGWKPRNGTALTDVEERWTYMSRNVKGFNKAVLGKKFEFRTQESEKFNRNNNSCIKVWYNDSGENGAVIAAYGWIDAMFTHEAYDGGATKHFVKADWAETLPELSSTGLTQIKWNAESLFNLNSCLTPLTAIVPYNLVFLPQDITDPHVADTYAVLDPQRKRGGQIPN